MDTQWQTYQVLVQDRADMPHRSAGAVHAPDAEMALENARDVFVRRPPCHSLWIVPERAIYARTVEELAQEPLAVSSAAGAPREPYLVFQKQGQPARETYVAHMGEIEADSPPGALGAALDKFSNKDVFVWWVVPARAVIRSAASDAPSMFAPAHSKRYRSHLSYPVEPIMRQLKSAQGMLDE